MRYHYFLSSMVWAFVLISLMALLRLSAQAAEFEPYYVSIKSDEANVRTGPSARYPIKWVFKRQHWPLKVVATFEQWQKIVDRDGQEGWMHQVLLSRKRYAIIKGEDVVKGYRLPIPTAAPIIMYEKNALVELLQCKSNWCEVASSDHQSWLEQKFLWGVDKAEVLQ